MTIKQANEFMKIELECIKRNELGCNRDCAKCDLVQDAQKLIAAYERVINYITSASKFYGG